MKWLFLLFVAVFVITLRLWDRFSALSIRVTFFDVAQGDSALVRFPGGRTMVIDAGGGVGEWNLGMKDLLLELARMGIFTLDHAVLSHPDQDHGLGFLGLFDHFKVDNFWFNVAFMNEATPRPLMKSLFAKARGIGARARGVSHETHWQDNGVAVELMVPEFEGKATNDRSLMVHLSYAGCSFLFTGDIETEAERWLTRHLDSKITVLKVAHHGSKTSSTESFLEKVKPDLAVVSAGLHNTYGHPHRYALARLGRNAKMILRTDFHGFIEVEVTRSGRGKVRTAFGPPFSFKCR